MRQSREETHQQECRRRQKTAPPGKRQSGTPGTAFDRGVRRVAAQRELSGEVHHRRKKEHHHHQCVGDRIGFQLHDSIEDLYRGGAVVAEHQRRAEFGKTPDQHDAPAGENARLEQRQRNPGEAHPPPGAEVAPRLVQRRIDVAERGHQIEVENRVEVERLNETDRPESPLPAEKIHRRKSHPHQQSIDHAVVAENLLKSERSDEGRQNHRQHHQETAPVLERELIPVVEQRQRERNHEHHAGGHQRDEETVPQPLDVDVTAEHFAQQLPVQPHLDHGVDRADQKEQQKERDRAEQKILYKTKRCHFPSRASRAASR